MQANGIPLELDEEDIELVQEETVVTEQTSLFGVRRRLVVAIPALGGKSSTLSKRKSSLSTAGAEADGAGMSAAAKPGWSLLVGNEKEIKKREEALEARERDLTIEALSKAEMAYVKVEVWTESRKGRWTVRGPAPYDGESFCPLACAIEC